MENKSFLKPLATCSRILSVHLALSLVSRLHPLGQLLHREVERLLRAEARLDDREQALAVLPLEALKVLSP